MRKYFLLSFAALMSVSTANATDGASNLTVLATVIETADIKCTPTDFGTLYFKDKHTTTDATLELSSSGELIWDGKGRYQLIQAPQVTPGTCTGFPEGTTFDMGTSANYIYLDEAHQIYLTGMKYENNKLIGDLHIRSEAVLDGSELIGSTIMQFVY